jgi:hypothetical protein
MAVQKYPSKVLSGKAKDPRSEVKGRQMNYCLGRWAPHLTSASLNEKGSHLNEHSFPLSLFFRSHILVQGSKGLPGGDSDKAKDN